MTDTLRTYQPVEILIAAVELEQEHRSGMIDAHKYGSQASHFVFRDEASRYWAISTPNQRWFSFSEDIWQPDRAPTQTIEGLDGLPVPAKLEPISELPGADLRSGEKLPAIFALERSISRLATEYRAGWINSQELETLLARRSVLDRNGSPWTIGFRSRGWYCYEEDAWQPRPTPPVESQLVTQADQEGRLASQEAASAFLTYLLFDLGKLPEPVTDAWEPPYWYPDAAGQLICTICKAGNPLSSRYCNQCGARFGCPNCGAENPTGSRFCNQCGQSLVE